MITALDFANPNDVVRLHINTVGGGLDTASAIIRAIKTCQAQVIGIVDGCVVSAGTMIMLACDDIHFGDMCWGMFHTASYGTGGDTNRVKSYVEFTQRHLYNVLYTVYTGFLYEEEIEDMFHNSREIYMSSEEMKDRWEAYVEYRDNLAVDMEGEEE